MGEAYGVARALGAIGAAERNLCQHRVAVHRAVASTLLAILVILVVAATASARVRPYTPCEKTGGAIIVEVSGATCDEARAVATALAGVPAAGVEAVCWRRAGPRYARARPAMTTPTSSLRCAGAPRCGSGSAARHPISTAGAPAASCCSRAMGSSPARRRRTGQPSAPRRSSSASAGIWPGSARATAPASPAAAGRCAATPPCVRPRRSGSSWAACSATSGASGRARARAGSTRLRCRRRRVPAASPRPSSTGGSWARRCSCRQRAAPDRARGLLRGPHERHRPVRRHHRVLSRHRRPALHDDHRRPGRQRLTGVHPPGRRRHRPRRRHRDARLRAVSEHVLHPGRPGSRRADAKLVTAPAS